MLELWSFLKKENPQIKFKEVRIKKIIKKKTEINIIKIKHEIEQKNIKKTKASSLKE